MTETALRSAIERTIDRELSRERRAGVWHYVPGQLQAVPMRSVLSDELPQDVPAAELSYVDVMGHACWLLCLKIDGEWQVVEAVRGGQTTAGVISPPKLSEAMLEALEAAVGGDGQTGRSPLTEEAPG